MSDERRRVSIREIMEIKQQNMSPKERATLPRDFFSYRPKLYSNLVLPSYVHGYSLAIEYMKNWFLSKFDKDYFKYVYINGKHVLDDWKRFNNYNIVREKPMLAIVPTVDYDNDRDYKDSYMMDHTLLLKRSDFQQSFIKDYENLNFIYVQMRELKMDFTFKVRLNSRAEQLDLFNRMEMWFRIGSTQYEYLNADFHIPYDIMLNMAASTGFEVKDNKIVDVLSFISYLNAHSEVPIIFKMRAINQKLDFFARFNGLYAHISTIDKLSLDDGERHGKLDTNFHIEMRCSLRIPIPHFYAYFNQEPIQYTIGVSDINSGAIGVYTINACEIFPQNNKGWGQLAVSKYMSDVGETYIDLNQILYVPNTKIERIIKYSLKQGINPDRFLDIQLYRGDVPNRLICTKMDYETGLLYLEKPESQEEALDIVIYEDKEYTNMILSLLDKNTESRINPEGK